MTPEREAFMREMEGNQFFLPDWKKLIECLDAVRDLRTERDELLVEVAEYREDLDLRQCRCVGCKWEGLANPIDLCPECNDCVEIE